MIFFFIYASHVRCLFYFSSLDIFSIPNLYIIIIGIVTDFCSAYPLKHLTDFLVLFFLAWCYFSFLDYYYLESSVHLFRLNSNTLWRVVLCTTLKVRINLPSIINSMFVTTVFGQSPNRFSCINLKVVFFFHFGLL